MDQFSAHLSAVWPGVLLVAGVIGSVIAWLATRTLRQRAAAATDQMVKVYEQTIEAKDVLALALSNTTAKQIENLRADRKEAEERHVIEVADYRQKLHKVRDELQACTSQQALFMAELAEFKARTDFTPVLKFQEAWYKESSDTNKQMLTTLTEVSILLKQLIGNAKPVEVHVMNESHDAVPTVNQDHR